MVLRIILVGLLLVGFSGCAASHKSKQNQEIEQLQVRINELEKEVEAKDQDIRNLEESLETPKEASSAAAKTVLASAATPKNIQRALKNAGFYSGKIDGKIGKNTRKAIRSFQEQNGLKPDGMVGKKTWEKLGAYLK